MKKCCLIIIMAFSIVLSIFARNYNEFDVIVIGTDPEGISAAISSARNGMNTLLIDTRQKVGGLFTMGGLNSLDMNYSSDGTLLTQGIFEEFFINIHPENATAGFWDKRDSFDIAHAEQILLSMINNEPNITLILGIDNIAPVCENNKIINLDALDNGVVHKFYGKTFIDATQDADIAALARAPYNIGGMDINNPSQIQAITQVFKINNVDWEALRANIYSNINYYNADMNAYSAWGFLDIMRKYEPIHNNIKVRGLNIGLQDDGSVLINAMQIIGLDPLNDYELKLAQEISLIECENITNYIKEHIPGFQSATYGGITEELYVRESRHIIGEYILSASDMMSHTNFYDKIAWGGYPIDIQTTNIDNWGYVIGDPQAYSIPFRCIIPLRIDNLLVASRSASYHSIGFGSVRVVPIGMVVAQAAGVACSYAVNNNISFREMAYNINIMEQIQQALINQGAFLENLDIEYSYENHSFKEGINYAYDNGLIIGSYNNELKLDDLALASKAIQMFDTVRRIEEIEVVQNNMYLQNEHISFIQLTFILFEMLLELPDTNPDKRIILFEQGVISEALFDRFNNGILVTNADLYQTFYELSKYLNSK
ncbi:hypothetical protein AN641_00255 [Candidatus Epulonipiscioides gigas]|nr:hypothetical protein AN641_00255 [Epulopiscium sp. SCG-C07WGA-EpuloA2]